jgi:hypothetical protein
MQPLDVAVFAPLKAAWRTILTGYKCQHPDSVTIKKSDFPGLLKDLLINAAPGQHLPAGFKKCGLFPVCPQNTMDRIPSRNMETSSESARQLMDSSLGDKLDQLLGARAGAKKSVRGKKIKVPPGKSYCTVDNGSSAEEEEENDDKEEEGSSDDIRSEDEESRGFAEDPDEPVAGPSGECRNRNQNSFMEESDTEGTVPYSNYVPKVPYLPVLVPTILISCQM